MPGYTSWVSPREDTLRRFVELFDRGDYWEAHETLEALWRIDRDPVLQGLIQVAATFVHVRAGRWGPARRVLGRALRHLEADTPAAPVDAGGLRTALAATAAHIAELGRGDGTEFDGTKRPTMAAFVAAPDG